MAPITLDLELPDCKKKTLPLFYALRVYQARSNVSNVLHSHCKKEAKKAEVVGKGTGEAFR